MRIFIASRQCSLIFFWIFFANMKQKNKCRFYTTSLKNVHFQKIVRRLSKFLTNKRYHFKIDKEVFTFISKMKYSDIENIQCHTSKGSLEIVPSEPESDVLANTKSANMSSSIFTDDVKLPTEMENESPSSDITDWKVIDEVSCSNDEVPEIQSPNLLEDISDLDEYLDEQIVKETIQNDSGFRTQEVFNLQETYNMLNWFSGANKG